jgi:hypothetical protein
VVDDAAALFDPSLLELLKGGAGALVASSTQVKTPCRQ